MKVAVSFYPVRPSFMLPMVQRMEELGYSTAFMGEHLTFPEEIASVYPYGAELGPPLRDTPLFDPLITLATIAAKTEKLRVGTSVYLLPLRHPVIVAKLAATLDVLSGGRFRFGVGSGWLKEEFDAADQPWDHRGARLEEAVGVMRRLWTEPRVAHEGRFYRFAEMAFEPKPTQSPIPIILGGETELALKRAARIGDGWTGVGHTPESAAERVKLLAGLRGDQPPLEISIDAASLPDLDALRRYRDGGVEEVIIRAQMFRSADKTLEGTLDNLTKFAETVLYPTNQ